MTAEQFLKSIAASDMRITAKAEEAYRYRALAERCTSIVTERVQTSPQNNREDVYVKLITASQEKEREANALIDKKIEVSRQLDQMQDKRFSELLRLKYVCCKTGEEVGEIMHFDESTMRKLHGKALNAYERQFLL